MKITKLNRYLFPAAALAATALLTACDPGTGSDGVSPAPTRTVTVSPSPSPSSADDALKQLQDDNKKGRDDLQKKIDEASKSAEAASGQVPNVVGMVHADAMATLHEAGFMVNEEDATGSRWIIDNSNWKVCSQSPAPGYHPTTLRVEIDSVKLDETCP
ncbi:PASTA domain-containing protein [Streptomyces sp. NPDC048281]|uniref:PASTA domain-containing protein n=1 Tax=Streptomyces sp. NPDC048281 TaxID=3154715 RepID=UPI00343200F9